jgi:hypothetical protein
VIYDYGLGSIDVLRAAIYRRGVQDQRDQLKSLKF